MKRAAAIALIVGLVGCSNGASDAAKADVSAAADVSAGVRVCTFGRVAPGGDAFIAIADGGEVELTRGFQGYLLVQGALAITGPAPRKSELSIHAGRDGMPQHASARPGVTWHQTGDSAISDPFEVWLSPALVTAFVGHDGAIAVDVAVDGAAVCSVETKVRFVDREVCMHYEDGTLDCTGAKKGETP